MPVAATIVHDVFSLPLPVVEKILRSVVVYVFLVVVLNETLNRVAFFSRRFGRLVDGSETYLIRDGKPVARELFRSGISLPELRAIARRQGYADLGEVHTAILEANGVVSMFKRGEPQIYHPAEPGGLRIGKRHRARTS